jgi:hypothetical protein
MWSANEGVPQMAAGRKVLQQQMMARGVAGRDRHHRHADALAAVVEAEPAGEEPVAEGDWSRSPRPRAGGASARAITSRQTSRSPAV